MNAIGGTELDERGPGLLRAYAVLLLSRVRAQASYRTSFALEVLGSAAIGLSELATVYVIFTKVDALGGLTAWQAALVFAYANVAFAVADLLVGHLDTMPKYLRTGQFDVFLLRPLSLLGQLVTSDLALRRVGRLAVGATVLAVALPRAGVEWTPAHVALAVLAPLSGMVIFGALLVLGAAVQFWLIEGSEFANAFTYGANFASSYPTAVYGTGLRLALTYLLPAAFVAYLPVLALVGAEGPPWLPPALGWVSPVAALVVSVAAAAAWRRAVRHYTGAGS